MRWGRRELGEGWRNVSLGAEVEIVVNGLNESGLGFLKCIAVKADDMRDVGDMADVAGVVEIVADRCLVRFVNHNVPR